MQRSAVAGDEYARSTRTDEVIAELKDAMAETEYRLSRLRITSRRRWDDPVNDRSEAPADQLDRSSNDDQLSAAFERDCIREHRAALG
jgi:hypothetical protein